MAHVPATIVRTTALCKMTALRKANGGVRGIAAGDVFRRLVTRAIAQQFADILNEETAPYQFALSTRAGTDCASMLLRSSLDQDADAVVVSIDGIGAYDHVSRSAIFSKLLACPSLHRLIPFVRQWYGGQSSYLWQDDGGQVREILQGEGIEQGDALAPALFALGIHAALHTAAQRLSDNEYLVAFLDDVYVKTTADRARAAFDIVSQEMHNQAQIDSNLGKCRAYGRAPLPAPAGMAVLGPDVWCSDRPEVERGITILGTPVGSDAYVQAHLQGRLHDQQQLLDQIARMPDPQCAWLVLMFCASPRANHLLRTIPLQQVLPYAHEHDNQLWQTLKGILGGMRLPHEVEARAKSLASLPRRLGGLGLQNAARTAAGAHWAAWADCLYMLHQRRPLEAAHFTALLEGQVFGRTGALQAAEEAGRLLDAEGFARPGWRALLHNERPSREMYPETHAEAGEWAHGWQFYVCSKLNHNFREQVILPNMRAPEAAMLRSTSGDKAGYWLQALPTSGATKMDPAVFQVALRRRLRVPLPMTEGTCGQANQHGCRNRLDVMGDHLAACPRTGLLARRANSIERA